VDPIIAGEHAAVEPTRAGSYFGCRFGLMDVSSRWQQSMTR
jgi:hypothetical protein